MLVVCIHIPSTFSFVNVITNSCLLFFVDHSVTVTMTITMTMTMTVTVTMFLFYIITSRKELYNVNNIASLVI